MAQASLYTSLSLESPTQISIRIESELTSWLILLGFFFFFSGLIKVGVYDPENLIVHDLRRCTRFVINRSSDDLCYVCGSMGDYEKDSLEPSG